MLDGGLRPSRENSLRNRENKLRQIDGVSLEFPKPDERGNHHEKCNTYSLYCSHIASPPPIAAGSLTILADASVAPKGEN